MGSADLIVTRSVQTARGVDAPVVLQRGRTVPGARVGHDGRVTFRVAASGAASGGSPSSVRYCVVVPGQDSPLF